MTNCTGTGEWYVFTELKWNVIKKKNGSYYLLTGTKKQQLKTCLYIHLRKTSNARTNSSYRKVACRNGEPAWPRVTGTSVTLGLMLGRGSNTSRAIVAGKAPRRLWCTLFPSLCSRCLLRPPKRKKIPENLCLRRSCVEKKLERNLIKKLRCSATPWRKGHTGIPEVVIEGVCSAVYTVSRPPALTSLQCVVYVVSRIRKCT